MESRLNAAQRAAVEHEQGPLLVLAGAGSGKTKVITGRIARLVGERGVRPEAILAVSFTNKAAGEMVERLARQIGHERASRVWMSTFHSFGVRFLGEEARALGYGKRFVIFDQGDSIGLIRDLVRRMGERRLDPAAIQARISIWKNKFIGPDAVPASDFEYDRVAGEIFGAYQEALRSMRAVDFDDLVVLPVDVLRRSRTVRDRWRARFQHMLVDEFQDTNVAQLELVKLLANDLRNVCVVGDDDQSIYGWRGAEVGNILAFEDHFPGTRVIKLEENYRSRTPILTVANAVIAAAGARRHPKVLRAVRGEGSRVRLTILPDAPDEAKLVAREIKRLHKEEGERFAEIGVLYRSNMLSRLIEEELRAEGIPYRTFGGKELFDRKEVKDAIAYLRAAVHPHDELSLRRIVNHPPRGIGGAAVERLTAYATTESVPFARAVRDAAKVPDLPDGAVRGAEALTAALERARLRFRAGELSAGARELFDAIGLERELGDAAEEPSARRRQENVRFLVSSLERFEKAGGNDTAALSRFLLRLTMRQEEEGSDPGERVTLSTLHASKGLEFGTVFLIGCVEGQLPHTRTTDPKVTEAAPTDVEEERRLFYVGVTRARDRLYLTRAERAALRGRFTALAPSRFLEGLPAEAIEEHRPVMDAPLDHAETAAAARDILARLGGI